MAITFAPRRGAILLCNFDLGRVAPEIDKKRQVIVVSIDQFNHKHGKGPGRSLVVPVTTKGADPSPQNVYVDSAKYWSFREDTWAACHLLTTVSHTRLSLLLGSNGVPKPSEFLDSGDLAAVCVAIRYATGLS
jgi:uncharacterized protein YifN (PemK superfamily)